MFFFKGLYSNDSDEPQFENSGNNSFCVRKYLIFKKFFFQIYISSKTFLLDILIFF